MIVSTREKSSIEAFVRAHQARVRGFLVFLGAPPHLLDDLVQDVFVSVLASPTFEDRGEEASAAYLRKAARHILLKTMLRERRAPLLADLDAAESAWVEYDAEDGGSSYLEALKACVARLTGKSAQVIELRYRAGLKRSAIGERMGLGEAGVHSLLIRTRRWLRGCVERRIP